MRVIKNKIYEDIEATWHNGNLSLEQSDCEIVIDTQGAKQLIELLMEFVEDKRKSYGLTREKAKRISITTEEAYISTYLSERNNISVGDSIDILEQNHD